ncbi:MAG: enolase C-terminal domain-like protein [Vulcanimicrobiaceae bacterium]
MKNLTALDAIVVEVFDGDGRSGFGEVTIIPGYTDETVDGGWEFNLREAQAILGKSFITAKRRLISYVEGQPHAASPLLTALETLERNPLLDIKERVVIPVLAPVRNFEEPKIAEEVAELLGKGHKTLKIKVGFDPDADLRRVNFIRDRVAGRARLRVDANQGYDAKRGSDFAAALDSSCIDWFEQPCNRKDWESNATVAAASAIPVMLDEQIYTFEEIQRAAGIPNVGYIKHVIEKYGSMDLLRAGLDHIRYCGMTPELGNGGATDISTWFEACVARVAVKLPCEFHSFLKIKEPLLDPPMGFSDGNLVIEPGYVPALNQKRLAEWAVATERFTTKKVAAVT